MKKGFSLIELLVGLIIVSLLISAFMPLITKKMKASNITVGSFGNNVSNVGQAQDTPFYCPDDYHGYNGLCYPNLENCLTYDGANCTSCKIGYLIEDGKCVQEKDPINATKEFCEKNDTYYLDKSISGLSRNICITKYNVGDKIGSSPNIPAGIVTALGVGTGNSCPSGKACCWSGKTGSDGICSDGKCSVTASGNGDSDYPGCNRTVCNYEGARLSCLNWEGETFSKGHWRLLNEDEARVIITLLAKEEDGTQIISRNMGKQGLQLCTSEVNMDSGFVACGHRHDYCPGSICVHSYQGTPYGCNSCYPIRTWVLEANALTMAYYSYYNGIAYMQSGLAKNGAFSARCVYDGLNYQSE